MADAEELLPDTSAPLASGRRSRGRRYGDGVSMSVAQQEGYRAFWRGSGPAVPESATSHVWAGLWSKGYRDAYAQACAGGALPLRSRHVAPGMLWDAGTARVVAVVGVTAGRAVFRLQDLATGETFEDGAGLFAWVNSAPAGTRVLRERGLTTDDLLAFPAWTGLDAAQEVFLTEAHHPYDRAPWTGSLPLSSVEVTDAQFAGEAAGAAARDRDPREDETVVLKPGVATPVPAPRDALSRLCAVAASGLLVSSVRVTPRGVTVDFFDAEAATYHMEDGDVEGAASRALARVRADLADSTRARRDVLAKAEAAVRALERAALVLGDA